MAGRERDYLIRYEELGMNVRCFFFFRGEIILPYQDTLSQFVYGLPGPKIFPRDFKERMMGEGCKQRIIESLTEEERKRVLIRPAMTWERVRPGVLEFPALVLQNKMVIDESLLEAVSELEQASRPIYIVGENPNLNTKLAQMSRHVFTYPAMCDWMKDDPCVILLPTPIEFVTQAMSESLVMFDLVYVYSKLYEKNVRLMGERVSHDELIKRTREKYAIEEKPDYDEEREKLILAVIRLIPEDMVIEAPGDGNGIAQRAAYRDGRHVVSSDIFPKERTVRRETFSQVVERVKSSAITVVLVSWLYGLLTMQERMSLVRLPRVIVIDQRLITGLWQASSSGKVWARGLDMWLEDGPLKIALPLPYFPFFLTQCAGSVQFV